MVWLVDLKDSIVDMIWIFQGFFVCFVRVLCVFWGIDWHDSGFFRYNERDISVFI